MRNLVAVDLSLTSTGLARIVKDRIAETYQVKSKAADEDTLPKQLERMNHIVNVILAWIFSERTDAVVIEGPALGATMGRVHQRGGLWWMVANAIVNEGLTLYVVPPSSLKMYTTGNGAAGKDLMVTTIARRFTDVDIPSNDVVDAVALVAMLARHLDQPIDGDLPKKNLSAMEKVDWTPA